MSVVDLSDSTGAAHLASPGHVTSAADVTSPEAAAAACEGVKFTSNDVSWLVEGWVAEYAISYQHNDVMQVIMSRSERCGELEQLNLHPVFVALHRVNWALRKTAAESAGGGGGAHNTSTADFIPASEALHSSLGRLFSGCFNRRVIPFCHIFRLLAVLDQNLLTDRQILGLAEELLSRRNQSLAKQCKTKEAYDELMLVCEDFISKLKPCLVSDPVKRKRHCDYMMTFFTKRQGLLQRLADSWSESVKAIRATLGTTMLEKVYLYGVKRVLKLMPSLTEFPLMARVQELVSACESEDYIGRETLLTILNECYSDSSGSLSQSSSPLDLSWESQNALQSQHHRLDLLSQSQGLRTLIKDPETASRSRATESPSLKKLQSVLPEGCRTFRIANADFSEEFGKVTLSIGPDGIVFLTSANLREPRPIANSRPSVINNRRDKSVHVVCETNDKSTEPLEIVVSKATKDACVATSPISNSTEDPEIIQVIVEESGLDCKAQSGVDLAVQTDLIRAKHAEVLTDPWNSEESDASFFESPPPKPSDVIVQNKETSNEVQKSPTVDRGTLTDPSPVNGTTSTLSKKRRSPHKRSPKGASCDASKDKIIHIYAKPPKFLKEKLEKHQSSRSNLKSVNRFRREASENSSPRSVGRKKKRRESASVENTEPVMSRRVVSPHRNLFDSLNLLPPEAPTSPVEEGEDARSDHWWTPTTRLARHTSNSLSGSLDQSAVSNPDLDKVLDKVISSHTAAAAGLTDSYPRKPHKTQYLSSGYLAKSGSEASLDDAATSLVDPLRLGPGDSRREAQNAAATTAQISALSPNANSEVTYFDSVQCCEPIQTVVPQPLLAEKIESNCCIVEDEFPVPPIKKGKCCEPWDQNTTISSDSSICSIVEKKEESSFTRFIDEETIESLIRYSSGEDSQEPESVAAPQLTVIREFDICLPRYDIHQSAVVDITQLREYEDMSVDEAEDRPVSASNVSPRKSFRSDKMHEIGVRRMRNSLRKTLQSPVRGEAKETPQKKRRGESVDSTPQAKPVTPEASTVRSQEFGTPVSVISTATFKTASPGESTISEKSSSASFESLSSSSDRTPNGNHLSDRSMDSSGFITTDHTCEIPEFGMTREFRVPEYAANQQPQNPIRLREGAEQEVRASFGIPQPQPRIPHSQCCAVIKQRKGGDANPYPAILPDSRLPPPPPPPSRPLHAIPLAEGCQSHV